MARRERTITRERTAPLSELTPDDVSFSAEGLSMRFLRSLSDPHVYRDEAAAVYAAVEDATGTAFGHVETDGGECHRRAGDSEWRDMEAGQHPAELVAGMYADWVMNGRVPLA